MTLNIKDQEIFWAIFEVSSSEGKISVWSFAGGAGGGAEWA